MQVLFLGAPLLVMVDVQASRKLNHVLLVAGHLPFVVAILAFVIALIPRGVALRVHAVHTAVDVLACLFFSDHTLGDFLGNVIIDQSLSFARLVLAGRPKGVPVAEVAVTIARKLVLSQLVALRDALVSHVIPITVSCLHLAIGPIAAMRATDVAFPCVMSVRLPPPAFALSLTCHLPGRTTALALVGVVVAFGLLHAGNHLREELVATIDFLAPHPVHGLQSHGVNWTMVNVVASDFALLAIFDDPAAISAAAVATAD